MTAVCCAISNNEQLAYILSDTAHCHYKSRVISGFTTKVWAFPHANAAFCGRGKFALVAGIAMKLQFCRDIDEMAEVLKRLLANRFLAKAYRCLRAAGGLFPRHRRAHSDKASAIDIAGAIDIEFYLVGFSARKKKMVLLYGGTCGPRAFELQTAGVVAGPALPLEETDSIRWPDSNQEIRDRYAWGKKLLEIMQRQRMVSGARPRGELIGGEAVLTTVTSQGISQQPLHRWNDKVGEAIS